MTQHTPGPPVFNEANRRRVDPDACACRDDDDGNIIYCATHAAAPDLLAALKSIKIGAASGYTGYTRDAAFYEIATAAQAAIAKAEEGS